MNIYLSQLVRVRGKYTFSSFSDFQTLDPWFPPKYATVMYHLPKYVTICHCIHYKCMGHKICHCIWYLGHKRYSDIVLYKIHIVNGEIGQIRLGGNFWVGVGVAINISSTRLNCILQDCFRDTQLDHIWRPQILCLAYVFYGRIWVRQIWSSVVYLQRSCKMQFRRPDLVIIGPLVSSYSQISFFPISPL